MTQLQSCEVSVPNLAERFGLISSMISKNFVAPWVAQPHGPQQRPARFSWACADAVVISRAQMPPLRLTNHISVRHSSPKYYAYVADQMSTIKLEGGTTIHLQPDEFAILKSDVPCEWVMRHDYTTSCLIIDSDFFHAHVPDHSALLARRLNFPFNLGNLLRSTLESAWEACCAGTFEQSGPKLVRAFLEVLTAVPPCAVAESHHRTTSARDIRRMQVKAFIEKSYADPEFSVATIADHLRLSQRYVQMSFAADEMTPSMYLRKCRLEACARFLRDPAQHGRSITEISFSCGFNNSAHFSTEFRRHFGMPPSEYRSMHAAERAAAVT